MKKNWATLCGIIAAVAVTNAVHAIPISGTLYMGGEATLDNDNYSEATTVTSWSDVLATSGMGAFNVIPDFTSVAMSTTPWVFAPEPGQALSDLWSVDGFQFDFQSDTVISTENFLTIIGYGTVSGNGYDTTSFEWELTLDDPTTGSPVQFTLSATAESTSNDNTVPDGGFTVALLGLALAGVEVLRRKLSKA